MPPVVAMGCAALALLLLCAAAASGLESPATSNGGASSASSTSSAGGHCPSACICKWKSGKQTAECISQGLFSVPAGLPLGLQVINLERNNFHSLPGRTFQERGLVNLQRVYLAHCRLGRVARDAFQKLTNLVDLDLSWNLLTAVPSAALKDVPHLRRLQLSGNPIAQLENASFSGLQHLTSLHLSRCQLRSIEPGALDGLPALEYLLLDHNRLSTLPAQAVSPLPRLSTLHLQGNPWQCDCRLSSLRRWMRTRNIPLGEPPRCAGPPRLESASWDTLSLEQFACPPQVHADSLVSVQEGRNATLVCRVRADPPAILRWEAAEWASNAWNSTNGGAEGPDLDPARFQVQREQNGPFQLSWLSVARAGPYDAGVYICVAENRAGLRAANTTLSVVQAPPAASGLSRTHKVVIVLSSFLALVILALLLCFVVARQRALAASRAKFPGMLKQLARKADLVEVATPSDTKAAQLAAMQRSPQDDTASSPTGRGDGTTPDLVNGKSGAMLDYARQPNGYGPVGNGYANPADPCYGQYGLCERYHLEEPPEPPHRQGLYSPPEQVAAAQWRVVEPTASWKRTAGPAGPPVLPACLAVGTETRYSPDEGYGEGNYEGTEV